MSKKENEIIVERVVQEKSEFNKVGKLSKKDKEKFEGQMKLYASNFLREHFNMELNIPIKIDGRLTRTGGSYHYKIGGKGILIKMSERFIYGALMDETEGVDAILDILKHELVHYALHEQGKDFGDGEKEFEETLAKLNIGSSGETSKKKRLTKKKNVWYHVYDVYYSRILDRKVLYKHTKEKQDWMGERIGYRIIKSYF